MNVGQVRSLFDKYSDEYMGKPGINGFGIRHLDNGEFVFVIQTDGSGTKLSLPAQIEGFRVIVETCQIVGD